MDCQNPRLAYKFYQEEWNEIYYKFLKKNHNVYWGECGLSSNPAITMEFIEKHIDKDWDWGEYGLSTHPMIKGMNMWIEEKVKKRKKELYTTIIILKKYITIPIYDKYIIRNILSYHY